MSYLSLEFVLLVAVTALVYYLVPNKLRGWVLLLASLVFYGLNNVFYLIYLIVIAATSFLCGKQLQKNKQKRYLWISICVAVVLWAITRGTIAMLSDRVFPLFDIVPLGISYYMFQSIAYVVDVYRSDIKAEKNFLKYLLFLSFFPAIVQGPISRYNQLAPQFWNNNRLSLEKLKNSSLLILLGLAKKMVVADNLAIVVDKFFAEYEKHQGFILYFIAVCYAFQLYMDFSGCVDICRGVSKLFGIELIDNFKAPYFAKSNKEFWSRWHISLSNFLKDYIYIPLGGNRKGKLRKYINILIIFTVSGVWHGYGICFLIWGLLHAIYQIVGETTAKFRNKTKQYLGIVKDSISDKIYRTLITFNLTTLAWIFFRSEDIESALGYIINMMIPTSVLAIFSEDLYLAGLNQTVFTIIAINIIVIMFFDYVKSKDVNIMGDINTLHIGVRWALYLLLIFDVLLFGAYGSGYDAAGFLYGGF